MSEEIGSDRQEQNGAVRNKETNLLKLLNLLLQLADFLLVRCFCPGQLLDLLVGVSLLDLEDGTVGRGSNSCL